MDTSSYYLMKLLPFVLGVAGLAFAFGVFLGWLFWCHYPAKAAAIEAQNEKLRQEIRRLTA